MFETTHDKFAGATIEPDSLSTGADPVPFTTWVIIEDHKKFWFTTETVFVENGNDFYINVLIFGFHNNVFAGSHDPADRASFETKESVDVKKRIQEYFSGPEDKTIFPFGFRKAKFIDVTFDSNWIIVKKTGL